MDTLGAGSVVIVPAMIPARDLTGDSEVCAPEGGSLDLGAREGRAECYLGAFARFRLLAPADVQSVEQVSGYVRLVGGVWVEALDDVPLVHSGDGMPGAVFLRAGNRLSIGGFGSETGAVFPAVVLLVGPESTVQALQDPSLINAWSALVGRAFDSPRTYNPFYDPPAPSVGQVPAPAPAERIPLPALPAQPSATPAGKAVEQGKFALWIIGAGIMGWMIGYLIGRYASEVS